MLAEQSENSQINTETIRSSMDRWWANCLRNEEERAWVNEVIRKVRSEDFIFTDEAYREALRRRRETGSIKEAAAEEV